VNRATGNRNYSGACGSFRAKEFYGETSNTRNLSRWGAVHLHLRKVEIFGGAQFGTQSSYNAMGWNASLTRHFKYGLGITGDFSGVYNSRGLILRFTPIYWSVLAHAYR
jgi:hypothetical protein